MGRRGGIGYHCLCWALLWVVCKSVCLTKKRVAAALQCTAVRDLPLPSYVHCVALADNLKRVLNTSSPIFMYLVTGARVSGKSVLINKVVQDQSNVVTLELIPQTP